MSVEHGAVDLFRVVVLLASAIIAVPLFKRLGMGSVLGYLAAGLIIGPFGLGVFTSSEAILHVAEFGVVMFLFVIGLEMKPSHLWQLRGQIFGLGSLQVVCATALLTCVGVGYGFSWGVSFIAASGFTLTSTAMVMQILSERHELGKPKGQRIVSILLFEDLLLVPLLATVQFLAPDDMSAVTDTVSVWQKAGIAALSLAALIAAGGLLNPLFRLLAKSKAREIMTAATLLVVLGSSYLMELGGLSMAMGAFLAGVLLSESSFRHQLEADIEPFRGLLLGLFFLAVGMSLDLNTIAENWQLILSGLVLMLAFKSIGIYIIARLGKASRYVALHRAILMSQGGEFAFVLLSAAAAQHAISAEVQSNMTAVVVLSMVTTPFGMMLFDRFVKAPAPDSNLQNVENVEDIEGGLRGNVLFIGFGRVGQVASQAALAYGANISIIENNTRAIREMKNYGFKAYYGDGSRPEVLHAAGAGHASCIVVSIDDREKALKIVENVHHHYPNTKVLVRAYDRYHALELVKANANVVIRETFESAMALGDEIVKSLGASMSEVETLHEQVKSADHERFALEIAGKEFEGRSLLLGNIEKH
ncbi:Kef-type potassium/proton antiporter (CPA2 family) [Mesocricetibacter intestinalis]|uniref:Kef-type potassium/proton antiporter (CPA2 family) n=1 Tax=Mesocricetibacter intestinalis TaxID=1521930 RepID=A0A4R6V8K2_9PAST|nr:monovalent cation:proton antiporter-2 (CPA2) family protein [Mesocricetibacter intestinalis]TDQ57694.1 Kef-type potassium/proton antiporter (CPA2 family) [Mesocricetibacter intestinalis]